MSKEYKLIKKILFSGKVVAETGLHIGGTNNGLDIGGINSFIVRNPNDNKPYIPGSSLKGKMRALLEVAEGRVGNKTMGVVKNGPCMEKDSIGACLFGSIAEREDEKDQRPSRIIVRDSYLLNKEDFKHSDLPYAHIKTEVVLDRITAKAMPRNLERVPQGAEFQLEMVLNIFTDDDEAKLINGVFSGLNLLQDDYLGGNGSRGYGYVSIQLAKVVERSSGYYLKNEAEKPLDAKFPIPASLQASKETA